jgi:hypothetical protein
MHTSDGIPITSNGHDIPTELYRDLTDHTGHIGDPEVLRAVLQSDGYLYLRGALDTDHVLAAREEVLKRLVEVGEVDEPAIDGISTGVSKREDVVDNQAAYWKSVCEGSALRGVTHSGRMLEIAESLHGEPVSPFDFLWLRAMPPGKASPFHFDHVYMNRGTDRLYTIWTPLGNVPLSHGGLLVIENSHTWTDLIDDYRGFDVDRDTSRPGFVTDDPVTLAKQRGVHLLSADFHPGDIVVMLMFTLHGSLDNNSGNRIRLSSDTRYQPASEPMDERFAGPNPRAHGAGYGSVSGSRPITAETVRR